MKNRELTWGLTLIAMGAMFLAANFLEMPAWHFGRLWPIILIVMGAGRVVFPVDGGSRLASVPLLLVGGIFLAHNYDVMQISDSWPLFIVSAGISVIASTRKGETC